MDLFLSTFVNRIDRKGRVSVPAPFRTKLAARGSEGMIALPSFKFPAIQCAGEDWMDHLAGMINAHDVFSNEQDDMTATLFASAKQLSFDSEGRVMLPEELTAHANLADEAAFVGRGLTFEIWQPAVFREYQAAARQRAAEKGMTLAPRSLAGGQ